MHFIARLCPAGPRFAAGLAGLAGVGNLHRDRASISRFPPGGSARLRAGYFFLRPAAIAGRPHPAGLAAIPAAPLLWRRLARANGGFSDGPRRLLRFSCWPGSLARCEDLLRRARCWLLSAR